MCLYTSVSPRVPEMEGVYPAGVIHFGDVPLVELCPLHDLACQVELSLAIHISIVVSLVCGALLVPFRLTGS